MYIYGFNGFCMVLSKHLSNLGPQKWCSMLTGQCFCPFAEILSYDQNIISKLSPTNISKCQLPAFCMIVTYFIWRGRQGGWYSWFFRRHFLDTVYSHFFISPNHPTQEQQTSTNPCILCTSKWPPVGAWCNYVKSFGTRV